MKRLWQAEKQPAQARAAAIQVVGYDPWLSGEACYTVLFLFYIHRKDQLRYKPYAETFYRDQEPT